MRIAYLGDIVGTPGRQAVAQAIPVIRQHHHADLVIANAENAANGTGLTPALFDKLKALGVDAMTLGDHAFKKQQIADTLAGRADLIRPANISPRAAGRGWMRLASPRGVPVVVISVIGRLFMLQMPGSDPFACVDAILDQLNPAERCVIVEVHAEATSEKVALGWHLNGRVSAVLGTHTHVATADARILPAGVPEGGEAVVPGTAYITDLGMTGPMDSVLGRRPERVLKFMTTQMPAPFDVAEGRPTVNGVLIDIDDATGRATRIERLEIAADVNKPPFAG